ncbi:MAG: nicotinate-nucleotide--dimethylbenzimidazole phosphoribosyltransferase [Kiritimatiellae bacterium]|nr:nicotinate-nucleotide--dimethylbenzimidazole phosphoribosyltransferase [Kiritimatiellia bacterium]
MTLEDTLKAIVPADRALERAVQAHLDDLTKPPGSLGRLEELASRYCLATHTVTPSLAGKAIVVFAADHGVTAEGVSAYPREVTPQMVRNMLAGGAAINVLARHVGAELTVVDIGVDDPLDDAPGLCRRKIRRGTANIATGPAMSLDEAKRAMQVGIEQAAAACERGASLLGTGEMGIGNTTPASALFAARLPCPVEAVTGRGTGLDDARLAHKVAVIERALAANRAALGDPLAALAALGGLEIAGICGLVLGAAARRVPIVVDGFISCAGAFAACQICEPARDYLFFSHRSAEAGHKVFFERVGVRPLLELDMRLGEGTGAALAIAMIEGAVRIYNEMATFSSAGVAGKEKG